MNSWCEKTVKASTSRIIPRLLHTQTHKHNIQHTTYNTQHTTHSSDSSDSSGDGDGSSSSSDSDAGEEAGGGKQVVVETKRDETNKTTFWSSQISALPPLTFPFGLRHVSFPSFATRAKLQVQQLPPPPSPTPIIPSTSTSTSPDLISTSTSISISISSSDPIRSLPCLLLALSHLPRVFSYLYPISPVSFPTFILFLAVS